MMSRQGPLLPSKEHGVTSSRSNNKDYTYTFFTYLLHLLVYLWISVTSYASVPYYPLMNTYDYPYTYASSALQRSYFVGPMLPLG